MAQLPDKTALGNVLPTATRPIAVADTTAVGRGIAQMGQGLQAAGTDLDYLAKKKLHEENIVNDAQASAGYLQDREAARLQITGDGDYATQTQRFQEANKALIDKYSGAIADPRARQIWVAHNQESSVAAQSAVEIGASNGIKQTRGVLLNGNLQKYQGIIADPRTDDVTRKQATDNLNATIDAGRNEGLWTPDEAQKAKDTFDRGGRVQLVATQVETKAGNAAVMPPPSTAIGTPAKGMISNNPGNLKYFSGSEQKYPGVIGPSSQVDQGTPQVQFASGEAGMQAAGQLALQKFDGGLNTINKIITDHSQGWTPDNASAAGAIAKRMGVDVNAPLNLRNKSQLQFFLKALVQQEQSDPQAGRYPDELYKKGAELAIAGGKPDLQAGPGYAAGGDGTTPIAHPVPGPGGPRANFANVQNMGDPRTPGWEQQNLTTIQAGNGQSWQVNKKAAEAFQGFLSDLQAEGYNPKSSGGYNYRTIRGSGKLSQHAFGTAIDIGAAENPMGTGPLKTDLPANVSELARKHGLVWGGDWANRKDPMHFEWAGGGDTGGASGAAPQAQDPYLYTYGKIRDQNPDFSPQQVEALTQRAIAARTAFDVQDRSAAALADQQRKAQVDQLQYGARNGQIGDSNIEDAWHSGQFKTYEEYSGVRAARKEYLTERDQGAGAVDQIFGDGSTTRFNPFDADSKKIANNAYNELVRAAPDKALAAVDAIQKRTGIVPQPAANGLRAAIFGADPATGGQAMQIAANLMARNPNAFAGVDGGDQIAKSAVAYSHFLEQGATTDDATRRVMQMNDPAYRSKVTVKDDQLKTFLDGITPATIGKTFDKSWLPYNDPRVGVSPEQQGAITQDFKEVAEQFYKESGDADLAMAQAKAQLSRVYGVSAPFGQPTVTKYPPERSYPPVHEVQGDDGHAYVYRQATEAVKGATGKDIPAADIALLPLPHDTSQAFDAGKPAPYRLAYVDRTSGQPVLQYIYGPSGKAAFVADPIEADAAVTSGRAAAFRAQQAISPPNGTPMATKDPGRYTADMAPKETSDGQGAMLPTSDADRKQWADEQNARLDLKKQSLHNLPPVSADTRAYAIGAGPDYADTPAPPAAAPVAPPPASAPTIPAAAAPSPPTLPPPTQDESSATTQRKRQIQVDERRKKAGLPPFFRGDIPS